MVTPAQSPFVEAQERNARQQELQMWQAAQTVRANVAAEDGLDAMLDCLGLTDVEEPGRA